MFFGCVWCWLVILILKLVLCFISLNVMLCLSFVRSRVSCYWYVVWKLVFMFYVNVIDSECLFLNGNRVSWWGWWLWVVICYLVK